MKKLLRIGFFREMPHGLPEDPSLLEARSGTAAPHEAELAAYLQAGHLFRAAPGMVRDIFDQGAIIGPPHYLTDGTHVWPNDVAHYVLAYHARLPQDFIDHAQARGFRVPVSIDVSKLSLP